MLGLLLIPVLVPGVYQRADCCPFVSVLIRKIIAYQGSCGSGAVREFYVVREIEVSQGKIKILTSEN